MPQSVLKEVKEKSQRKRDKCQKLQDKLSKQEEEFEKQLQALKNQYELKLKEKDKEVRSDQSIKKNKPSHGNQNPKTGPVRVLEYLFCLVI